MIDLHARRVPILCGIVVLGAGLRLWGLGADSFWQDETWTWGLIRGTPGELLQHLVRDDAHPPLYFLLLQAWSVVAGTSEAGLRLFSALLGIASLPLMYRMGARFAGTGVGLLAALFLACSPFHVYFSQEARSYSLLFFLCLCSLNLLTDLWSNPDRKKGILLAVVTAAIMLTHYMGAFFILSEVIVAVGFWRRRPDFTKASLIAFVGAGLLFLPWLPTFITHITARTEQVQWFDVPSWEKMGWAMAEIVTYPYWGGGWIGLIVSTPFYAVAMLSLWSPHRARAALMLVFLMLPMVGEAMVSQARPIFYSRTFLYVLIPLWGMVSIGLQAMPKPIRVSAGLALVTALVPGLLYIHRDQGKEDWRQAVRILDARVQPHDKVVVCPGYLAMSLDYYAHHTGASARTWVKNLVLYGADSLDRAAAVPESAHRQVLDDPAVRGVWVVTRYGRDRGWFRMLEPSFDRVSVFRSWGAEVYEYRLR